MAAIELTEDQQHTILREAANGQTIQQICDRLDLERLAFLGWRRKHPEFERELQIALDEGVEAQVDGVCVVALEEDDMARAKIHGEFMLKVASKRLRARYGESLHLTGEVKVDLVGVLKAVQARKALLASSSVTPVSPESDADVIDADWERVPALTAPDTESGGAAAADDDEDIFG